MAIQQQKSYAVWEHGDKGARVAAAKRWRRAGDLPQVAIRRLVSIFGEKVVSLVDAAENPSN